AMDEQSLREACNQLRVLRDEKEQAEREGHATEAAECRDELERLQQRVKAAMGIRGKVRDLNDLTNKLRPAINARPRKLYQALRKAKTPLPKLADHLEAAIRSEGVAHVYRPAISVCWKTTT